LTGIPSRNSASALGKRVAPADVVKSGIAALKDRWTTRTRFSAHRRWITWTSEGPELGASTRLARCVEGNEARLVALLSIAFERPVGADVIGRLKRAEADFRNGAIARSAMEIALANLPPLDDLESGRRLHMAAGLLDLGFIDPLTLLEISDIDGSEVAKLLKYSEDQPRVPAGQGGAGQWTGSNTSRAEELAVAMPEGCHEEWQKAIEICEDLLNSPNPSRALTGGHTTAYGCAKGLVSARCGGNPV